MARLPPTVSQSRWNGGTGMSFVTRHILLVFSSTALFNRGCVSPAILEQLARQRVDTIDGFKDLRYPVENNASLSTDADPV